MSKAIIDAAYEKLESIRDELLARPSAEQTEADTRALMIDRILGEVLGWKPNQIHRETLEDGERLDYRLSTATEHAIIEAKRAGLSFGIPNTDNRWYKRQGPIGKSEPLAGAVRQADDYAVTWGCGLACATNGNEWVLFLANRTDGVSRDQSSLLVFRSIDDLLDPRAFKLFFEVLGEPSVRSRVFRFPFLHQEGVVQTPKQGTSKRLIDIRGEDRLRKRSDMAKALEPLLKEVFEGLSHATNPNALRECFVETHESREANARLQRIAAELTEDIDTLPTDETGPESKLARLIDAAASEPDRDVNGKTVLILGQNGSGKSTFLDIFFNDKIDAATKKRCIVVHLDLSKADPDHSRLPSYLKKRTLDALKRLLYEDGEPSYDELKGVFFDEYHKLARGALKPLKEGDPAAFEIEFGRRLEEFTRDDELFLQRLIANIYKSRKRLLCLVFDNADHFDDRFQQITFLQAQWIASLGHLLLLLPMRDTTYWRAREQSGFHAVRNTLLYLPRPPLTKVIEKRFDFAIGELGKAESTSVRSLKGLRISIKDPASLLRSLKTTFTQDVYASRTIAMLSSGDVREALRVFESCVSSGHIAIDKLIAAYLVHGEYRVNRRSFERAVFLGDWEQFSHSRSKRICNLLCTPRDAVISPLLAYRVLERCYEMRTQENEKIDRGFESVAGLLAFFSLLGVPREHTDRAIGALLYASLLEPYDLGALGPSYDGASADAVGFVKITSAGVLHRRWLEKSPQYVLCMLDDMQVFDEGTLTELKNLSDRRVQSLRRQDFQGANTLEANLVIEAKRYALLRDKDLISMPDSDRVEFRAQRAIADRLASPTQTADHTDEIE